MDQSMVVAPVFHLPISQTVYGWTWPDSYMTDEDHVLGGVTLEDDLEDEEELLKEKPSHSPATDER